MAFRVGKLASWALLLVALAALLAPFLASLPAQPIEKRFEQGDVRLALTLDRDRVFLPSQCVTARWQVEGIREVYFNGEGVVGEGQRTVCPADGPVALRAVLMDGAEQTLVAQVPVTSVSLGAFALFLGGAALLALVCSRGSIPVLTGLWARAGSGLARVPVVAVAAGNWLLAHPLVVVGSITLLGAALRIHGASQRPLVFDEAVLQAIASGSLGDVIRQNAQFNSAPPLFALAVNPLLALGKTELLLRAIPLFVGIAAIPAFFVLARRFVGCGAAYLATLGLATALGPLYYAQYAREYSLTLLLTSLVLLCFFQFRARPSRRRLLALGACWVVAIFTQYGLALLILPLNLWLLLDMLKAWQSASPSERRRIAIWMVGLQAALALAVGAVFFLSLRQQVGTGGFGADGYLSAGYWDQRPASLPSFALNTLAQMPTAAFSAALYGQSWEITALLALTGFGALAVLLARRRTPLAALRTLILIVFGTALAFGLAGLYPYAASRQTTMLTGSIYLLVAVAFAVLLRLSKERAVAALTALAVLFMVGANLQNAVGYYAHPGYDDITPIAADLAARWQDGDKVVVFSDAQPLFEVYFLQRHPDRRADSVFVSGDPANYAPVLDQLVSGPGRIWVLAADSSARFADYAAGQPWAGRVSPQMAWTNMRSFLISP